MTTTHFLRWGRLAQLPATGKARIYAYTHTGQARIIELDKAELCDLIDQANDALAAIHHAEAASTRRTLSG